MIKTITATTTESHDKQVNDFMKTMNKNLPVRTQVLIWEGKILFCASIFYDEKFEDSRQVLPDGRIVASEETVKEKEDTGALWIRGEKISGQFMNEKIILPADLARQLREKNKLVFNTNEGTLVAIPNKYKKEAKHPDYRLFRSKE